MLPEMHTSPSGLIYIAGHPKGSYFVYLAGIASEEVLGETMTDEKIAELQNHLAECDFCSRMHQEIHIPAFCKLNIKRTLQEKNQ